MTVRPDRAIKSSNSALRRGKFLRFWLNNVYLSRSAAYLDRTVLILVDGPGVSAMLGLLFIESSKLRADVHGYKWAHPNTSNTTRSENASGKNKKVLEKKHKMKFKLRIQAEALLRRLTDLVFAND